MSFTKTEGKVLESAIEHQLQQFPTARFGVMGSVGGTWSTPEDYRCSCCGGNILLVTWIGRRMISRDCPVCLVGEQLSIPGLETA